VNGRRRQFLDRTTHYLFSYDVELEMANEEIGFVGPGVRVNVFCRPNESRIYHIIGEASNTSSGLPTMNGLVVGGGDWALFREDDVEISEVKLTIQTDDGAIIDSHYRAVLPFGAGGYRWLISEEKKIGTHKNPVEAPVVISPVYETSSPKYRWLTDRQCVGFGLVQIIQSRMRRVSYDIFAMD